MTWGYEHSFSKEDTVKEEVKIDFPWTAREIRIFNDDKKELEWRFQPDEVWGIIKKGETLVVSNVCLLSLYLRSGDNKQKKYRLIAFT